MFASCDRSVPLVEETYLELRFCERLKTDGFDLIDSPTDDGPLSRFTCIASSKKQETRDVCSPGSRRKLPKGFMSQNVSVSPPWTHSTLLSPPPTLQRLILPLNHVDPHYLLETCWCFVRSGELSDALLIGVVCCGTAVWRCGDGSVR